LEVGAVDINSDTTQPYVANESGKVVTPRQETVCNRKAEGGNAACKKGAIEAPAAAVQAAAEATTTTEAATKAVAATTAEAAAAAAPEAAAAAAPEATPAAQAATTAAAEASTEEDSDAEESGEEQRGQYGGRVEEMRGETTEEVSDEEESGEEQRGQHGGMVEEMRGESTEESTTTLALTVARTLTLAEAAHAARGAEIKAAEEAEPSKGPEERQWNCTACTFENNAFDVLCVMCETPRHSDQWTCPKCSFRNPCTETECIVCGPSGGNAQAVSRAVTRSDIAIANRKAEASTEEVSTKEEEEVLP
jgi:hypothetical protein